MWTWVAVGLYLLPLLGFCLVRFQRARPALAVALDLPLAVALDFLLTLLLSRVVRLDYAALSIRGLELVALLVYAWRYRASIGAELRRADWRRAIAPLLGAALALALSLAISVPYAIWDRHWHIPLAASLRGQHAPFHNVYEPERTFFYHYAGDALAAILQSLSFAHLHASATLSRAHDVFYALTGWFLVSSARALGVKRGPHALALVFCTLAAGPGTVLFEGAHRSGTGWSTINLLSLSFRPHEPLGYFFALTLVVAVLGRCWQEGFSSRRDAAPSLASAAAVLALSDELTLGLTVGCVGLICLFAPRDVSWRERLGLMFLPVLATGLTVLVLGGTFAWGAPKQAVLLVPPRVPGFYYASLPFATSEDAWKTLLCDYVAPFGVLVSAVISAFGRRDARGWSLLMGHVGLFVVSLLVLTFVQANRDDIESHRAVTGLNLLSPLLLALWWARLSEGELRAWVLGIGGIACMVSAISTLEWVRGVAKIDAVRFHSFWGDDWFYETDCVKEAGARIGQTATLAVGPQSSWYRFAGCRPLYAPAGGPPGGHAIVVGWPDASESAFSKVAPWAQNSGKISLFYANEDVPRDPVALSISQHAKDCRAAGSKFRECTLDARGYAAFRALKDRREPH